VLSFATVASSPLQTYTQYSGTVALFLIYKVSP
jgi:hypothetical protein